MLRTSGVHLQEDSFIYSYGMFSCWNYYYYYYYYYITIIVLYYNTRCKTYNCKWLLVINQINAFMYIPMHCTVRKWAVKSMYRGADKSLARPWKETSYSDQDLQHYTKTYGVQTAGIYCCCLHTISVGIVLMYCWPCISV